MKSTHARAAWAACASAVFGGLLAAQAGPPSRAEVVALLVSHADEDWREKRKLAAMGTRAFPVYDDLLADPKTPVLQRCRILEVLTAIKGDCSRYIPHAHKALLHPVDQVRIGGLNTLSHIGGPKDTPPIVALLFDEVPDVVTFAAVTLRTIGGPSDLVAFDAYLRSGPARGIHPTFLTRIKAHRDKLQTRLEQAPPPAPKP